MTVLVNNNLISLSPKTFQRMERAAGASVLTSGLATFIGGKLIYRGMEITGKPFLAVRDELAQKMPQVSVISMKQVEKTIGLYNEKVAPPEQQNILSRMISLFALVEIVLSFLRAVGALPQISWDAFVESSGVMAGALFVSLDANGYWGAHVEHSAAQTSEHSEKYCKAAAKLAAAIVGLLSSILYFVGKMAQSNWVAISGYATEAVLAVSSACAAISLVVVGTLAALGIYRCRVFAKRLKGYNDPQQALQYLLDAVTVEENQITQRAKEKIEYVRARTSTKAVGMILEKVPSLLERLKDGDAAAIEEAQTLLKDVVWEGTKKQLVYMVGLFITMLMFASTVLGMVASGGSLPLIFLAASIVVKVVLIVANRFVDPNEQVSHSK